MYYKPLVELAKKEKIKLRFVRVVCKEKEILKRVKNKSRTAHGKLTCPIELKERIDDIGFDVPIPYVRSLKIDNTRLSAKGAARKIKKELGL